MKIFNAHAGKPSPEPAISAGLVLGVLMALTPNSSDHAQAATVQNTEIPKGPAIHRANYDRHLSVVATPTDKACVGDSHKITSYPGRDPETVRRNPAYDLFDVHPDNADRFFRIDARFDPKLSGDGQNPILISGGQILDLADYLEPSGDTYKIPLNDQTAWFFNAYDEGKELTFAAYSQDTSGLVVDKFSKAANGGAIEDCTHGLAAERLAGDGDVMHLVRFTYDPASPPVSAPNSEFCPATQGAANTLGAQVDETRGFFGGKMLAKVGLNNEGRITGVDIPGVYSLQRAPDGSWSYSVSVAADINDPLGASTANGCTLYAAPVCANVMFTDNPDGTISVRAGQCVNLVDDLPSYSAGIPGGYRYTGPGRVFFPSDAPRVSIGGGGFFIGGGGRHDNDVIVLPTDPEVPVHPENPDVGGPDNPGGDGVDAVISTPSSLWNLASAVGFLGFLGLCIAAATPAGRRTAGRILGGGDKPEPV